jgi:N-carbamoyl-L-amino-acid hydrolase
MRIDGPRLLADLRALAEIGRSGRGVHRLAYSPEDRAGRAWLAERMAAAGLAVEIDGIGNVIGRMPKAKRAVLIGSHTDSVPKGGWLDGALGVIYAVEIARALGESGAGGEIGIDAISFAEEEGTYLGTAGSLSFCGELGDAQLRAAKSVDGKPLLAALDEAGYGGRPRRQLDPARHIAFIEGHIEQGPRLEANGKRIGAVTGIVGIRRHRVRTLGQADHAGTTPMAMRKDAGAAMFALAADLTARFRAAAAGDTVWNFGHVRFEPGAGNVVPAAAELLVEFRDLSDAVLDPMAGAIEAAAAAIRASHPVRVEVSPLMALPPSAMEPRIVSLVESAAQARGVPAMRMPSGAGHDAMILARHLPTGMLFIPSIGGRSHDGAEDTAEADVVLGAEILADMTEAIIAGALS